MNQYPCRCRRCGARRTLAELPENMRNGCKCKVCQEARAKGIEPIVHCDCGGAYRVDWYRKTKEHKQLGCQCSGFPFDNGTHRKGSASPSNRWYCYDWKGEGYAADALNSEESDRFQSYRLEDVNLIVTVDEKFYKRFAFATATAKRANLLDKAERIALFQAVLYGNIG